LARHSLLRRLTSFLVEGDTPVTIACRVPEFDPDAELGRGAARRLDRFTHLALIAAREAVVNAGLSAGTTTRSCWAV
jgi:3-oxoacyl-[acyl-carrier-protein] synthase II